MWHASVSLRSAGTFLRSPGALQRAAVTTLSGVGGDHEWWLWNPKSLVGHLRVPVTAAEALLIPPGLASSDAGETGPQRARSYPPGGR